MIGMNEREAQKIHTVESPDSRISYLATPYAGGWLFPLAERWTPIEFIGGTRVTFHDTDGDGKADVRCVHGLTPVDMDHNGIIDDADAVLVSPHGADVLEVGACLALSLLPSLFEAGAFQIRTGL